MNRLILVLITAAAWLVGPISCRQEIELPRKWQSSVTRSTSAPLMDPCQKERSMKMICHCEHQTKAGHHHAHHQQNNEKLIRAAECWILKSDLTTHDPLWKAFDKYNTLSELTFIVQSGSLTFLPTPVFKKLIHLSELTVSYSSFTELEGFAFANSSSLYTLRINNNMNLSRIKRHAFSNHIGLERIDLQLNGIQEVDREAFENLTRLEYLALNDNKISALVDGVFGSLNNLLELQLQHNWISSIRPAVFHRLENLRVLKLSSNKLTYIGNAVFTELWSLQELYLDANNIESLSERAFVGLNNLRRLSLQRNRLTSMEKTIFTSVPVLDYLFLSHNRLKTVSKSTFMPILDNFSKNDSSLSLTGNSLVCDCALNFLNELRNRTSSAETQKSIDSLQCLLADVNQIPEEVFLNTLPDKEPRHSEYGDYISDDSDIHPVDLQSGTMVNIRAFDQIPCQQDDSDPTSLPMPRESIGFRDSAGTVASSSICTIILVSVLATIPH